MKDPRGISVPPLAYLVETEKSFPAFSKMLLSPSAHGHNPAQTELF